MTGPIFWGQGLHPKDRSFVRKSQIIPVTFGVF